MDIIIGVDPETINITTTRRRVGSSGDGPRCDHSYQGGVDPKTINITSGSSPVVNTITIVLKGGMPPGCRPEDHSYHEYSCNILRLKLSYWSCF
jgi:hypothetical protein